MNPVPAPGVPPRRSTSGWRRAALTLVFGAAFLPGQLTGQGTDQELVERRLEYASALAAYEAAEAAFNVVEGQRASALAALEQARRNGDEEALNTLFPEALERSRLVQARLARLEDTRTRLEDARQALMNILTVHLEELGTAMSLADPQQAAALDAVWRDLNNELHELEEEADDAVRFPVVLPEIRHDPRDTQADRDQKAAVLERLAALADSTLVEIDSRIEELEARLRTERTRRDMLARAGRFDDTPPVAPTRPPGDPPVQAADSLGVGMGATTLEGRIEELRIYRRETEIYRDELLIRARTFRTPTRIVA